MPVHISAGIYELVPDFKIGVLVYHDITVAESPQMLEGRIDYFQEELALELENKSFADVPGLAEWRKVFKALGTDPSRYRPSAESLYRRVKKGGKLPSIHSVADLNNFFSLKYEIPFGIYDLDKLDGPVEIRIGKEADGYEGINGREMNMKGKLLSADTNGAFGSPIVDSKRTMVTEDTTNALQLVYLRPSADRKRAEPMLEEIGAMFEQIHGGTRKTMIK
ncbi:MAG TPA: phenylalanine--tRNA ligase beta subunit-related protein [Bacillales bacterium]|nr:phenylalanine--tRNA ligase beta subunit-related protein [Bacillales bacterium]